MKRILPNKIYSGKSHGGHVQGIAVDEARGFVYYAFTTELIKTDLEGNLLGSVVNLIGHLGCIAYDAEKNKLYGSLELKHDGIGMGIVNHTGKSLADEDAFYIVSFDVEGITEVGIDAEKSGIMRAVYLRNVFLDYTEKDEASGAPHRYGCSGIDGISIGPEFGRQGGERDKVVVTYGVYRDNERGDNDYQVLLQYDKSVFDEYAKPLIQAEPHHNGPESFERRYFFYTGNTTFGIQNLEYDPFTGYWFVAVYDGQKPAFRNFKMYYIDGGVAPRNEELRGRDGEVGAVLSPAMLGERDGEYIRGCRFPYGSTGMASLGDGYFYFSEDGRDPEDKAFYTNVRKYRFDKNSNNLFEAVE